MKKLLIFISFNILLSPYGYTQISEEEQLRFLLTYAIRANHFNAIYPQEKVYLHFDNTAYFSGETIWFSANVLDAQTNNAALSKVLYVELLSPTGVVLQQQKLKIENGRCHGAFPLVDASVKEANAKRGVLGYPSGYYEVRAYTRSMLNFDVHGCFSRVFPVYEIPEKEGNYDHPIMKRYLRKEKIRTETEIAKGLNLEFFPEGGHLICGVENRIAFKATDNQGKGVDIEELMIGDELMTVSQQHLGMGYFIYTPKTKRNKADILHNGKYHTFALPESEEEGYALQVSQDMSDTLCITIKTSYPDPSNLLAIALMHAGNIEFIDTLTIGTNCCQKCILTHRFSTGVYQLCMFDIEGEVRAKRMLFFNNRIDSSSVSIKTNKTTYLPFEKIQLDIETTSTEEQHLSLAVRDGTDYGTMYSDDIRTYMLLSSELKGYIERPEYYFENDDEEHQKALDLLMMVQGWSRYKFEQMQKAVSPNDIHYTEECLVLDGRTLHPRKNEPMQGVEVRLKLYSPDRKSIQEINAISDKNGYWGVNLQDYEGDWELNIQTYKDGNPIVSRLRLERSSAPKIQAYSLAALALQDCVDTTNITNDENLSKNWTPLSQSILLEEVEVEGQRRYVDYCTFQAFNVEKDVELIIDKGEQTNTVADYLMKKGYEITYSKGEFFDQYLNSKNSSIEEPSIEVDFSEKGTTEKNGVKTMQEKSQIKDLRSEYVEWLIQQSTINEHRTLWYIREGNNNSTSPSTLPGYDIDIANVKSIMVYDSPHSYINNEMVVRDFGTEFIQMVQKPMPPFPTGLYVVEIILHPGRKNNLSWNKNTRQTTFAGYSPQVEYYSPKYPNGPIQGDADYRRTLYWNPDVKITNGKANIIFYNNSYSKKLNINAEGIDNNGNFIVYDNEKETN